MKKLLLISALLLVVGCEPKYDKKAELFPEEVITTISSFQEKLKLDYHQIPSSLAAGAGGGIEVLGDDSLLITLDNGEMFLFNTLKETFSINSFNLKGKYSGIRDILINKELSEYLVLGVVDTTNNCKAVKLDSFNYTFDKGVFKINNSETIWESEEVCDIPTNSGAGGRIVFYQDNYFISTGYFSETRYGGFERGMNPFPQSPSSSFGKVIKIDRSKQNTSSTYTLGHRVPEGLFVSNDKKQLFLTEHGPKGGDEINVLLEDNNYGWPCKTRGSMYGYPELYSVRWPEDLTVLGCKKNNFIEPLFTWTTSIAISQGIHYRGNYFKGFDNNFIIGSLGGLSLFRIFYQDGRVINQERIRVGKRIRDILQTQDQRIVLYTDGGSLILVSKSL